MGINCLKAISIKISHPRQNNETFLRYVFFCENCRCPLFCVGVALACLTASLDPQESGSNLIFGFLSMDRSLPFVSISSQYPHQNHIVLFSIALHCTVLSCIALYCIVSYCIVLCCSPVFSILLYSILFYSILFYSLLLNCILSYRIVLYCTILHCSALQCTVLYCLVLYCFVSYSILF